MTEDIAVARKGDIVLFNDGTGKFPPAIVVEVHDPQTLTLCVISSGFSQPTENRNRKSYGFEFDEWCFRHEEPKPKPREKAVAPWLKDQIEAETEQQ